MFAEKPLLSNSNPTKFYLPPVHKKYRRRRRPPPTSTYDSTAAQAAHIAENVSELKAKYADYAAWLKTSHRPKREPMFTQALLKSSLCQMGIDVAQAEQLVSKCSWYVYQFQKNLKLDPEQKDQIIESEKQKGTQSRNIFKKTAVLKDSVEDSTMTFTSFDKDDSVSSNPIPRIRPNYSVLPGINSSSSSTSSRLRRVDFDNEHVKNPIADSIPSKQKLSSMKTRKVTKLQPLPIEPLDDETQTSSNLDFFQANIRREGFVAGNLRSILRKQRSTSTSVASTEISNRKTRSRVLTPSSTVIDNIPLGTRSRRLFGGSECFAQIMNELEQQNDTI